jgi:tRNA (guanosine-2'-O-)-methyltransferase
VRESRTEELIERRGMEQYPRERPEALWYVSEARYRRMWEVAARRQLDLALVAENVHDAHNVSAVLRSCDAVGVGGVHLVYTHESFPQLNKTTASSANLWLGIRRHADIASCYAALRAQGLRIYATALAPEARSPYAIDLSQAAAIVLGNEQRGVSEEALALADEAIYIPMQGMVQSFNISVAAAIVLAEAMRQRLAQGCYELPEVLSAAQESLLGQWLRREESRRRRGM